MLAFSYRFHGHSSLRFVYSKGRVFRTDLFVCKYVSGRRRTSRIAVVVSKKVMKSAVGRNRIRRRIYESIRRQMVLVTTPTDIVLIVTSPDLRAIPSNELDALIAKTLVASSASHG